MQVQDKTLNPSQQTGFQVVTGTPKPKHLHWWQKAEQHFKNFIKEGKTFFTKVESTIKKDVLELSNDLKQHDLKKFFGDARQNIQHFALNVAEMVEKDSEKALQLFKKYGPEVRDVLDKTLKAAEMVMQFIGDTIPKASVVTTPVTVAIKSAWAVLGSDKFAEDVNKALQAVKDAAIKVEGILDPGHQKTVVA